ncbi:MAG: VCBS repeat-containing protein, partial [Acidobacteria bacterium]|nr:VCBS repeat-containing protein [Acidobacteriota bacterium]
MPTKTARLAALLAAQLSAAISAAAAPPVPVRLTDITERAGITFRHVASPDKKYIVESMSGGVALFDYDNDGLPDIFFVNSLTVDLVKSGAKTRSALYRNNGDGTFTDVSKKAGVSDPSGYYGLGVICSDFDDDGLV